MDDHRTDTDHTRALQRSAHELQRDAGDLVRHAAGGASMPALSTTLAHVEEALDRLSVGMLLMARAVATSRGQDATIDAPPTPEAEALCFYLRRMAEKLREPQAACEASRTWTRRALDVESDAPAALEPTDAAVLARSP